MKSSSPSILNLHGFQIVLNKEGYITSIDFPKEIPTSFTRADLVKLEKKLRSFPVSWETFTPFTRNVYEALQAIPMGETRTYGEIARQIQSPHAARAIGRACATNPLPLLIPCHRIVSTHSLTGFAFGLEWKTFLLKLENAQLPFSLPASA